MPYQHLLSSLEIGRLRLRNRIAMSAMGVAILEGDGMLDEHSIRYYEERARGGVGLIVTEPCAIAYPRGAQSARQPGVSNDSFLPGFSELARRVHAHGAAIAAQLAHHGKAARLDTRYGRPVLMPSRPTFAGAMDMADDLTRDELEAMTAVTARRPEIQVASADDIAQLVDDFAAAAERVARAGVDAVEIHAAHGYVLSEFLSPAWNKRDDEYGGSVENRARLLGEVIAAVKRRVGADFPVWCRIDAIEYRTPGGITPELAQRHAELAVDAGADAIHVSAYADATSGVAFTEAPLVHREAGYAELAAGIKARVGVPVIAVGRIEPAAGDALIRDGKADVVAMARKMLADPEIALKLSEGREQDVRPCIYCYRCVAQPFFDRTVHCGVNPAMGREAAYADVERELAAIPRRILIVGGGPAGLEAARVAARRGHQVVLLEKSARLGGRLRLAAKLYEPNRRLLEWMIDQVEEASVDIRLDSEATIDSMRELAAESVLVGVGGRATGLEAEGARLQHVLSVYDDGAVFDGDDDAPSSRIGARVAIVGATPMAIHLADLLSRHGREVTVLAPDKTVAAAMAHPLRWRLLGDLRERGVSVITRAAVKRIALHTVEIETRDADLVYHRSEIDADTVITALPLDGDHRLVEQFEKKHVRARAIGDADGGGSIEAAIDSGFRAASEL